MSTLRVKTDITINANTGNITVSARLVDKLMLQAGDVLDVVQDDREYLLYVNRDVTKDDVYGCLYTTAGSRTLRCCNKKLAKVLAGNNIKCKYRTGGTVTYKGKRCVAVITRRNYYEQDNDNTAAGR